MADKRTKKCLASLVIREMQIYTTTRYYDTPIKMLKTPDQVLVRNGRSWELSCSALGNVKCAASWEWNI